MGAKSQLCIFHNTRRFQQTHISAVRLNNCNAATMIVQRTVINGETYNKVI